MVRKFLRGIDILLLLLIVISTFSSCANELNVFEENNNKQINFSVLVPEWKNTDSLSISKTSRATPIMDTSFGTDKSFNLIADQNDGTSSYTTLIDKESVFFRNSMWQTDNPHYWSGKSNNTVNFYAYYPSNISDISHTVGSVPTLSYTVPDNVSDQIDIMTATGTNVSGNTNSSTPLTFNHIFAAVKFCSGNLGLPSGNNTIIKIKGVQYKGIYTFNNGWLNSADRKDFYQNVNLSTFGVSTDITNDGAMFMMLPQTFSNITIEVTYNNGLVLSKTISGKWEANNVYTYNLSKSIVFNYDFTGASQTFTAPYAGTYKIECWGAKGGNDPSNRGASPGKGAYTSGYIRLISGKQLFLYVGGIGNSNSNQANYGGWNGGGTSSSYANTWFPAGGGGATDVRLIKHSGSDGWSGTSSLRSRIMVAAGGGGGLNDNSAIAYGANGGDSKGCVAYNSANSVNYTESIYDGTGATQISCGSCPAYDDPNWEYYKQITDGTVHPFGYFGYANQLYGDCFWAGGGGGGWWGGISIFGRGGGGGSSFVSGMSGCVAMSADGTQNSSINYMTIDGITYTFMSPVMKNGASSMPSPSGGTEMGHNDKGYARITFVSAN